MVGSFLVCLLNEKLNKKLAGSHGIGFLLLISNLSPEIAKLLMVERSIA